MKQKIKCLKCNYEWETKSVMIYVNCPNCRQPVKNFGVVSQESTLISPVALVSDLSKEELRDYE